MTALEEQVALEAGAAAEREPAPAQEVVKLTVVRSRTHRVLHVVLEGERYDPNTPRHVWLPRPMAMMFRRGMEVLGREMADQPRVYDYEGDPGHPDKGRKFPRRAGEW